MEELMKDFAKNCAKILKLVNHSRPKSFDDPMMKKIGEAYKEYHRLSGTVKWERSDIVYIRKGVKKFNFAFKWNDNKPIDLQADNSEEVQKNILNYEVIPGMTSGDINVMMNYFIKYPFTLFDDIPIEYILAQGPYQEVIWKQIQITYCYSQMINGFVATTSSDAVKDIPAQATVKDIPEQATKTVLKQSIYNEYSVKLQTLQKEMTDNVDFVAFLTKMENDKRFDKKVGANKMDASKIKDAKEEVLAKFGAKGLKSNDPVFKIVNMITDKLDQFETGDPGSMVEQIMDISKDISGKLEAEVSKNEEEHKDSVDAIKSIFSEAINNPGSGDEIPQEFKNIAQMFFNNPQNSQATVISPDESNRNTEIYDKLENIIAENNLDRTEFYKKVTSSNGSLDIHLLQQYMSEINLKKQ
jgi:hypothetical protein